MNTFRVFAAALAKQFKDMSKHELFRVGVDGQDVWDAYLAAFPEGTNPIYRVRTEHDGSYDRNVVRKLGNVVRINDDGTLTSIWDIEGLPYPYDEVAARLGGLVVEATIVSLFRTRETKFGYVSTIEKREGEPTHEFFHFHADIAKAHQCDSVGKVLGNAETTVQVLRRGLEEIPASVVDTVLELIEQNTLYRGAEFKAGLIEFRALQGKYNNFTEDEVTRNEVLWRNYKSPAARIRNTVIGQLLQDLAEEKPLELAVKSYEKMVAPANYKRPTALITPGMIAKATETIRELGLEPALERRFAVIGDVSVNNVLWVDGSVAPLMKDKLTSLLMDEVKAAPIDKSKAKAIAIDEFMANVLPGASTVELFFDNKHRTNLVSLIAPVHSDAPTLFKWGNGFSWSYNGNIADSELRQAVAAKGGRVDGAFRFSHSWNHLKRNASLMDLHVFMPGNKAKVDTPANDAYGNDHRVGWNHRNHPTSGGTQDVDYTPPAPVGKIPVENITFPSLERMPDGQYVCKIHNWQHRAPTEGGFRAEIEFDGQVFEYDYTKPLKNKEWVTVAVVDKRGGEFFIEHKIPSGVSAQVAWGLTTQKFVKVDTVLNSPNHWDGEHTGNKHWFFVLDGCRNDEPARGLYNEFLASKLEEHRKVFEVLGSKTKCEPSAEQLSGLGFSSTKRDTVTVRVTSKSTTKLYQINF